MTKQYLLQSEIAGNLKENELLRTGKFVDMDGNKFEIKTSDLLKLKDNFYKNPMMQERNGKPQLPINLAHDMSGKAAGWIHGVEVIEDGKNARLVVYTEWVGEGKRMVEEGEYSFISAEIDINYKNIESGESYGLVLRGAGLTNRPAVKGLRALLSEPLNNSVKQQEGDKSMDFEQIMEAIGAMSDDQKAQILEKLGGVLKAAADTDKETAMTEAKAKEVALKEAETKALTMEEKVAKLEEAVVLSEKKEAFAIMLSEGKAVEAQRDAFIKGDIAAFAEAHVSVNLSETGHGKTPAELAKKEIKTADEAADKLISLTDELEKKDSISFKEASAKIYEANPELVKLYKGE